MHSFVSRALEGILLRLMRHSYSVRQRLHVTADASIEGHRFRVPLIAGAGEQNLRLAPHDSQLRRVARKAMAFRQGAIIDVGCNIGHFMQLCLLGDRSRRYVGFDPNPACCYYLENFIRENALPAHSVLPVGLSNRTEALPLLKNGPFDVCATVNDRLNLESRFDSRGVTVTVPGDRLLPQLGLDEIALVKIDVEGHELEVLEGLEQTIARERPLFAFEVLLYADLEQTCTGTGERVAALARERRQRSIDLEAFFRDRGYVLFRIKRDTSLAPLKTLDPGDATDHSEMDHVAVPREQVRQFLATYHDEAPVEPSAVA